MRYSLDSYLISVYIRLTQRKSDYMCTNPIIPIVQYKVPVKSSLDVVDWSKFRSNFKANLFFFEKNVVRRAVSNVDEAFRFTEQLKQVSYLSTFDLDGYHQVKQFSFPLPCRKCSECLQKRSKDLAVQATMEARSHEENSVLILTYDNDHLGDNILDYDHIRVFQKRLRRYVDYHYGKKIKFLTVGEYGDKKGRMHWHMIVFGWKPKSEEQLEPYLGGKYRTDVRYRSRKLKELWKFGYVDVDEATDGNIFYVARYVQKKFVVGCDLDSSKSSSRREKKTASQALGLDYFFSYLRQFLKTKRIVLNGFRYGFPRYFKDLLRKLVSEDSEFDTEYYNALRKRLLSVCSYSMVNKYFTYLGCLVEVLPVLNFHDLYQRALRYMDQSILKPHASDHDGEYNTT